MMADLGDLYQQTILDHNRNPRNFRTVPGANRAAEGNNPLCGDRITMMLALSEDGRVTDVAFTGRGCAISQASASLLTDEIRGQRVEDLQRLRGDDVLELLGIEISPARLKCALLSLDTLQRALDGRGSGLGAPGTDGSTPAPVADVRAAAPEVHA